MNKRTITKAGRAITATSIATTLWLCAAVADVHAAGFALNEFSPRELGMANAVTGFADRASAIVFNPAGLATQDGLSVDIALAFVFPDFGYDTTVPETGDDIRADAKNDVHLLPTVFATYRLHDRVAVGLGVYAPFGLGVRWPDTLEGDVPWWGRTTAQEVNFKSVAISPTVAVKLHDRIYLGAGFSVMQASVTLQRAVASSNDPADDIQVRLSGDDIGFGASAGVLFHVIPQRLNLGVSYRSAVAFTFAGNAAFTKDGSADNIPAGLRPALVDGKVEAPITVPHVFSFGVATFPLEQLKVGLQFDITTWSTYDNLEIRFVDQPSQSSIERKDWKTVFALRLGAEYQILEDNLPVRLGLIYDESPVPDDTVSPELPDADRWVIAGGIGYNWAGLRADLAYQFMMLPSRDTADTVPVVGSNDGQAHIVSLGLGYDLDL